MVCVQYRYGTDDSHAALMLTWLHYYRQIMELFRTYLQNIVHGRQVSGDTSLLFLFRYIQFVIVDVYMIVAHIVTSHLTEI